MRGEARGLAGDLVVQANGVAESQRPEVALVVLRPA
jgi:hypothetical protein